MTLSAFYLRFSSTSCLISFTSIFWISKSATTVIFAIIEGLTILKKITPYRKACDDSRKRLLSLHAKKWGDLLEIATKNGTSFWRYFSYSLQRIPTTCVYFSFGNYLLVRVYAFMFLQLFISSLWSKLNITPPKWIHLSKGKNI